MDEQRIYRAALAAWGADAQTLMVFEEMAELQKELCKAARGKDNLLSGCMASSAAAVSFAPVPLQPAAWPFSCSHSPARCLS